MALSVDSGLFRKLVTTVTIYALVYGLFFAWLGGPLTAAVLIAGGLLVSPSTLELDRRGKHTAARLLFCLSCILYIWSPSLAVRELMNAEYYYLPVLMLSVLLFRSGQNLPRLAVMIASPAAWFFHTYGPTPDIPQYFLASNFPLDVFKVINFLGASILTCIFVTLFLRRAEQAQQEIEDANKRLRATEAMGENLQEVAKIGGWEMDVATQRTTWTPETYRIHGVPVGTPTDRVMGIDFYATHDRDRIAKSVSDCISGIPFSATFEFFSATGQHKWVEARGEPVRDATGQVTRLRGTFRDVTAEVEARESRDRANRELDQFFEVSPELLGIADTLGVFRRVSSAFPRLLGYTEEELTSRPFLSFIHPDDIASTQAEVAKLAAGQVTLSFENRYRSVDGSYRRLLWSASPDPKTGFLYAAARDVTDLRAKQKELEQLNAAINSSAIVAITDAKGIIQSVNDNFTGVSGYSSDELIGQTHRVVNSGLHTKEFFSEMWKTITSGRVWSGELKNRKKNGQIYVVQTVIAPLVGTEGKIERFIAIRFDITSAKESEARLIEAQQVAKIGSWTFDLKTQEIHWSGQMFDLFPERAEDGPPSFERHQSTIHPDDRDMWDATVTKCSRDGEPYRMRFRVVFPDRTTWIEALGRGTRDSTGSVTTLGGTCQDVTGLVHAEEALRLERARALQSAKLASLGEMAAGVAHEINNPLAIISGTAGLLPKLIGTPDKLIAKVATIERATDRIVKIVNGLRKFSRSSESTPRERRSLSSIAAEVLTLTESRSKRHSVTIKSRVDAEAEILCNEIEIEQVLINLINNAIDAVQLLPERWVEIHVYTEKDESVVRIRDSGYGIKSGVAERLFQPFFTTKTVGEGTGLGLSIVKGILDDHGAHIELLTQDAHTCFEIRFKQAHA